MIKKESEKKEAVKLRLQGLSYNEILKEIPVAKSTLSLWLRDVGLAKKQKQELTEKRRLAQQKAQEVCKNNRIIKENHIIAVAKNEINRISKEELLLIGATLYWAEGSKQKKHNVSQGVSFGNTDPSMILLFIKWVREICNCSSDRFVFSLYIHDTADKHRAISFWEKLVDNKISWIYLKKHKIKTKRKNINDKYFGLLRVDIRKSTDLNRKIKGWVLGIIYNLKIKTGV
jgi:hypothetical protein